MPLLEPSRLAAAGLVLLLYAALCLATGLRERRRRQRAAHAAAVLAPGAGSGRPVLVSYASQTGFAEQLARAAAEALQAAGTPTRLLPLGQLTQEMLADSEEALFLVSTCGEGDPPDNGALFARRIMAGDLPLAHLHYGLLALGDSEYARFCGFGRALDGWLRHNGAHAIFPAIEVDNGNAAALQRWQHELGHIAGTGDLPDWRGPAYEHWRLSARRLANPGSAGAPAFHVELVPADGAPLPAWEAGDLVQVLAPANPERPREYSIASLPQEGRLLLLVRQQRDADGALGAASGWLTEGAGIGAAISLRLRPHENFRLGANAGRPLILVGNGTGIAGLRAHLRQRERAGASRNWLIFGERNAAADFHYREEVLDWQQRGLLARLDLAFSRDGAEPVYVQHRLADATAELRQWLEEGAAIYVCGNAVGMAPAVDAVISCEIGEEARDELIAQGRYRRDVY